MHFLVTAKDNPDSLEQRKAVRASHLALGDEMIKKGQLLFAAATLDQNGKMDGSMMVLDFPDRQQLNAWLNREPYVVNRVWGDINVQECQVGPSFCQR